MSYQPYAWISPKKNIIMYAWLVLMMVKIVVFLCSKLYCQRKGNKIYKSPHSFFWVVFQNLRHLVLNKPNMHKQKNQQVKFYSFMSVFTLFAPVRYLVSIYKSYLGNIYLLVLNVFLAFSVVLNNIWYPLCFRLATFPKYDFKEVH